MSRLSSAGRSRGPPSGRGSTSSRRSSDALVDDVAGEAGGLPLLSTALLDLWREREGRSLTLAAYERTGGVRGAVGRHAEAALRSLPRRSRRSRAGSCSGSSPAATARRSYAGGRQRDELDADENERVARVLAMLVERRLLVADNGTVELVHEALLEQWPRLSDWLDEDAHGRRLHQHLTHAALDWEAEGRDQASCTAGPDSPRRSSGRTPTGAEAG